MKPRVLAALLCVSCGCGGGGADEAATIAQATRPVVFEGLPHPGYEPKVFQAEKAAKPTVEFGGYAFYRDQLDVTGADISVLKTVLGDRSSYKTFSGEKKCGGFHPDFAVEWYHQGAAYRALICFGCREVKVVGLSGEQTYDMADSVNGRLKAILKPYRKNRPSPREGSPLYFAPD
jgi:hypothetical protein